MIVIRIQECSEQAGIFQTKVSFNQGSEYDVTVRDPFSKEEEERLEWYFEQHLKFPFIDQVKAQEATTSVFTYGENLFAQVFSADAQILSTYKAIAQEDLNTLQIEIVGQPSFHALHWETLKDPEWPQPLALQAAIVRKNSMSQGVSTTTHPSPTINLLIVIARPHGRRDMAYRTISGPLVEVLRQENVPVQVSILRPGTYKALENHLHEITNKHGVNYYHVIHFDVHGSLLTDREFRIMSHSMRNHRLGRQDIRPYEGLKAFLALEGQQEGIVDLVEAEELAALLKQHQIPIAILNACQSGKQVGERETSLGSYLVEAGVQMVVAMGYSVTVSAAELLMRTLYQQLFAKDNLTSCIRQGRIALYNHKARRAYFNQTIELEDWLLPVVYQNQQHTFEVRGFTLEESAAFNRHVAILYASPQPKYGFVGRDLDILQIEKCVLMKRNIVLVRGMGGAGKTTLLQYLGWWWQTTGFVKHVFYFGYDQRAWTCQQILVGLAHQLLSEAEYSHTFQPLSLELQVAMLVKLLRIENHLLILDNLESITGSYLAIAHILQPEEQQALQGLLSNLVGGRTLVLLGSRSNEQWLSHNTFEDNIYNLQGLDPEAASTLANRILEKCNAIQYRGEDNFRKLLKLLDGFPLALEVVLSNLSQQAPVEILAALQAGDVKLDTDDNHDKTASILHCIDYSYSNLSSEIQMLLYCLAPFTSVVSLGLLGRYTTHLQQQVALASLHFEQWSEVIKEAENWGLLSRNPNIPIYLHLQPILSYFLRKCLNISGREEMRHAIEVSFYRLYDEVSSDLKRMLFLSSKDRQSAQNFVHLEYENLIAALNLVLTEQVSAINLYSVLSEYLSIIKNHHRALELGQMVLSQLEAYPTNKRVYLSSMEIVIVAGTIAEQYTELRMFAEAKALHHRVLALLSKDTSNDTKAIDWHRSITYQQLGSIAEQERQWEQAEEYYQKVLSIDVSDKNYKGRANTYHQLGIVAFEQRKWKEAQQYFEQALQAFISVNDILAQAATYQELGGVAEEQKQWEQAEKYYKQVLDTRILFNDRHAQARIFESLGRLEHKQQERVDREKRQWKKTEMYYQRALSIFIIFNDYHSQAGIYHQLGMVAEEQKQWEQAEAYYKRSLQIYSDLNDFYAQARNYNHLGRIYSFREQWEQAENYYQQAINIYDEFGNSYKQATIYAQLGLMTVILRQWAKACDFFIRALEKYIDSEDIEGVESTLGDLAVIWKEGNKTDLPNIVASLMGITLQEVDAMFTKILERKPNEIND